MESVLKKQHRISVWEILTIYNAKNPENNPVLSMDVTIIFARKGDILQKPVLW